MENPYNQVAYHSSPFPQAHINRLASRAVLMGMNPPELRKCRVLELGCGDGSHLIPMALQFPESRFLGEWVLGCKIKCNVCYKKNTRPPKREGFL